MFANERTIICSYSVRTGAMNRSPTPTECTLQLFMRNQCLFHEHVIFTHVHQRLPTCTHCRGRFIVPAYYGIHAADNRVQPMFIHVHQLWCVIAFIQFGVDGRDESAPTPTECTLRIVLVHQHLPTCTHCDAWLHLYNSVWTGAINRPLRLRNTRCGLSSYTNVYPRTPIVIRGCNYTIRCETGAINRPLRLRNVRCGLFTYTNIYPRAPNCDTGCNYTIRCRRARWIGPYAYGMYAAIVYVQSMFTPRTRNIYPRTPTFTPRTPTFTHVHPL